MRNIMKNKIVKHFYVRETKKDKKGEARIYLRITVNGEEAEISADRRVNPGNWDKAADQIVAEIKGKESNDSC
jgi:Arm DNA-binding domain